VSSGLVGGNRRRVDGGVCHCSERDGDRSCCSVSVLSFDFMLARHVGMYRKESRTERMSFCSSGSVAGSYGSCISASMLYLRFEG
jgi:hypothetical protein